MSHPQPSTAGREPGGSKIKWTTNPARISRLFDWLDANPVAAACIFGDHSKRSSQLDRASSGATKTKAFYLIQAVKEVLAADEDPSVRTDVLTEPKRYSDSLTGYLTRARAKYQTTNYRIGPDLSRMPWEDILKSGQYPAVACFIDPSSSSSWKRLHKHCRTLPHYNQYWDTGKPFSAFVPTVEDDKSQRMGRFGLARDLFAEAQALLRADGDRKPFVPPVAKADGYTVKGKGVELLDIDTPVEDNSSDSEESQDEMDPAKEADDRLKTPETSVPLSKDTRYIIPRLENLKKRLRDYDSIPTPGPSHTEGRVNNPPDIEERAYKRQKLEAQISQLKLRIEERKLEIDAEEKKRKDTHDFLWKIIERLPGFEPPALM